MYIGDGYNHRIRKVTIASGIITPFAGTGVQGYSGDGGAATAAMIQQPEGVALDSAGNVYFGDYGSYNVIRKVTVATGIISTFAGTGSTTGGYNGDNIQATTATLHSPDGLVLDSYGDMYIADRSNNRIRKVDGSTCLITTVVGTGAASSTGDGSVATAATINGPCFSTLDGSGNLYISECQGYRVRKVITVSTDIPTLAPSPAPTVVMPSVAPTFYPSLSPYSTSVVSTIAGTGATSYSGDGGPGTSAALDHPSGIDIDSNGNVYFSDFYNNRVRKITASTGIISTYAGNGATSYSGDGGQASSAALHKPNGLCIDSAGNAAIHTHRRSHLLTISPS